MGITCRCPKCKGLIVRDSFLHFCTWLLGIRCVNCGWVKIYGYDKAMHTSR